MVHLSQELKILTEVQSLSLKNITSDVDKTPWNENYYNVWYRIPELNVFVKFINSCPYHTELFLHLGKDKFNAMSFCFQSIQTLNLSLVKH